MKAVQDMTQAEFVAIFNKAGDGDMVASNITKRHTTQDGGYWYVADAGDCDGANAIQYWFGSDADENGYVQEIDACI